MTILEATIGKEDGRPTAAVANKRLLIMSPMKLRYCLAVVFMMTLSNSVWAGTLFPPANRDSCGANTHLMWSDTAGEISCEPDYAEGILSSSVTVRFADTATSGTCGFTAKVLCEANEIAISGGAYGLSNIALQNSNPVIVDGQPRGWQISALDTWQSRCSINDDQPPGTVQHGNPPAFSFANHTSVVSGGAMAVCIKYGSGRKPL